VETTGRYLILFREEAVGQAVSLLSSTAGFLSASAADFEGVDSVAGADAVVFDKLGVAVVSSVPPELLGLAATDQGTSPILAIEPERVMYAIQDVLSLEDVVAPVDTGTPPVQTPVWSHDADLPRPTGVSPSLSQYLQGYRAGINTLVDSLIATGHAAALMPDLAATAFDESNDTWGLQATGAARSSYTGRGVRVAVLDTGLDLLHPDFAGRTIVSRSFVSGEPVQDGHGHGTHTIGTACGALRPSILPRYGVASNAEIYAGKVLSNAGRGGDAGILAGINWAIANNCKVVSMSLGAATRPGDAPSLIYEAVARRALRAGTLIIAAAGNESDRRIGVINPVGRPANCPSIMAVAALDSSLQVTFFSNRGMNPNGGNVDIAGPGLDVYSSWPMPTRYRRLAGTSMATPHVSGIAALLAEANPAATAPQIWRSLVASARRLPLSSADVGAGLVQAP
jgi:subtilisin family serine protease